MSAPKTVGLTIDGRAARAAEGTSVLRAAEQAGLAIPHFCDHPGLEPEGNCRMCLVEIEGLPKLELSCATMVREGLVVRTATERVRQARRDVLEFLLAEHPLDCPICDKAGECLLQDYYDLYGLFPGRMMEPRERRAKKVPIGRRLILDRERCVVCTRCVRFLKSVTRTGELGVFERGLRSEIGVFDGAPVDTLYSGNLVDICPVGAITAEDFRFRTRAWFLARKPSICPHCGRGCAVFVESVAGYPLADGERRVYRVTAREDPAVNGHWICDLGREGRREIDEGRGTVVLRKGEPAHGLTWPRALAEVAESIRGLPDGTRGAALAVVLNSRLTCEELARARAIFEAGLGSRRISFADRRPGQADSLLLTAERTPNLRGAVEAGFDPRPPTLEELAAAKVLVIYGSDLTGHYDAGDLARAFAGGPAVFLFAAHSGPLDGLADLAIPVSVTAEKTGTYINVLGLRRSFTPASEPPAGVPSEGAVLDRLAQLLGLEPGGRDGR